MGIPPINGPVRRGGKTPRTRDPARAKDRSWATQRRTPGYGGEGAHPLEASTVAQGSPGSRVVRGSISGSLTPSSPP